MPLAVFLLLPVHFYFHLHNLSVETGRPGVVILILEMWELRLKEVRRLAQSQVVVW